MMTAEGTELLAAAAIYLEQHYGVSFGVLIIPASLIIFLIAVYYMLFKYKPPPRQEENEKEFRELEKQMLEMNAKDAINPLMEKDGGPKAASYNQGEKRLVPTR